MPKTKPRLADVEHDRDDIWKRHMAAYMDMCPICSVKLERTSRISRFHSAFVKFGYSTLTRDEVAAAYDIAIDHEPAVEDGIIARLVRTQLVEAGLA